MPMLFVILVGLIVYALTLPGAGEGVAYYLTPDFSKIDLGVINSAMGQAFFSLSLGMGALITYGSYISKQDNITTSATIVTLADTAVAFLSGLLMLPLVFSSGLAADASGPGLVFTILPSIFDSMGPFAGRIVGGTFFLLLCVAALTSTISLLEVPVAYMVDEKKWPRRRSVILLAAGIFLLGLPSMLSFGAVEGLSNLSYGGETGKSFLDLVADTFSEVGLPLGGMLLSIFIAYRWKTREMSAEIAQGNPSYEGSWLETFINVMISYVCPIVLALIFLSNLSQKFLGLNIL
jgi:NSS family neurotransmitter:Na+ symporter